MSNILEDFICSALDIFCLFQVEHLVFLSLISRILLQSPKYSSSLWKLELQFLPVDSISQSFFFW